MPNPRSPEAPKFDGERVSDFIEALETHADDANVDTDDLPSYVLRYCTEDVRDVLNYCPQIKGKDWEACKTLLRDFYGSNETIPLVSTEDFSKWIRKQSRKSAFADVKDLDRYHREFMAKYYSLKSRELITSKEADQKFYQGLPQKVKTRVRAHLPNEEFSVRRCPTTARLIAEARKLYDEEDLDLMFDKHAEDGDDEDDDSGDESSMSKPYKSSTRTQAIKTQEGNKKTVHFEKTVNGPAPVDTLFPMGTDSITEQFSKLSINQAAALLALLQNQQNPMSQRQSDSNQFAGPSRGQNPHCWFCDTDGHIFSSRFCPGVNALLDEGLIRYNNGKVVRANGDQLPFISPGNGGMVKFLRDERSASKGKAREDRDEPPHMRTAKCAGLQFDGRDVLTGNIYSISAERHWSDVYTDSGRQFGQELDTNAVTRSQTKKDHRTDPLRRPDGYAKLDVDNQQSTPSESRRRDPKVYQVPQGTQSFSQTPFAKAPLEQQTRQTVPATQLPATSGPRQQTQNLANQDVNMKDGAKGKPPSYRFTSDVQESVSTDAVQNTILDTRITLPLRDLLGVSPDLQKRVASMTKTRREYKPAESNAAIIGEYSETESDKEQVERTSTIKAYCTVRAGEDQGSVAQHYASAFSASVSSKLFAMATGKFKGTLAGKPVVFMVDTGSELNLIPAELQAQTGLPIDLDGSRWSLRGIHGNSQPLKGCCRDVSITIGGKPFDHHFFVNAAEGKQDVILGQPWLVSYAAELKYTTPGSVEMILFAAGERSKQGSVSVRLLAPDMESSARNTDRLVLASSCRRKVTVDDATDDEQDFCKDKVIWKPPPQ